MRNSEFLRAERDQLSRDKAELVDVAAALLDNRTCSCGGWKCARCKLAVREVKAALRKNGRPVK